jgi:hypothetical protein
VQRAPPRRHVTAAKQRCRCARAPQPAPRIVSRGGRPPPRHARRTRQVTRRRRRCLQCSCPSTQHAYTPTSPRRRARGSVARHAVRVPAASAVGQQHSAWRTPRQADACTASAGRTASARVPQRHAVGAASPASSPSRSQRARRASVNSVEGTR